MSNKKFQGTGVAIVTPFRDDHSIDFNALEKVVDYIISNHVDYIVALGTTGESVTLSMDEKQAVISCIKEKNEKRVPLVVGCGGNHTRDIVKKLKQIEFDDVDAILSVSPYYNKPSQEGIYQHYQAIANESPAPVILYNVPGRTGSNICAETTIRLAAHKNIIGIKEASGNMTQIMHVLRDKPADFLVISGEDALTYPMVTLGGNGVISVIANVLPYEYSEMVRKALNNEIPEARKLQLQLLDMMGALFKEGNPAGVKAAMTARGLIDNNLRLPLVPVSKQLYQNIEELLKQFK